MKYWNVFVNTTAQPINHLSDLVEPDGAICGTKNTEGSLGVVDVTKDGLSAECIDFGFGDYFEKISDERFCKKCLKIARKKL